MFEALRRDVRMVVNGLRGRTPSPLVRRGPSPVYAAAAATTDSRARARAVQVAEVIRETEDAVTLVLAAPFAFIPGQFLTVIVELDGESLRRAYSISSGLADPRPSITVKRMGRVSGWLVERAAAGMTLQVLGPSGDFTLAPDAGATRNIVAIAGGSGITPMLMSISVCSSENTWWITRRDRYLSFRSSSSSLNMVERSLRLP